MRIFGINLFGTYGDGVKDEFEDYVETQMLAGSREEAINLTGDDAFYTGNDRLDDDDVTDDPEIAGFDIDELEDMEEDDVRDAFEEAGLDYDDYGDF